MLWNTLSQDHYLVNIFQFRCLAYETYETLLTAHDCLDPSIDKYNQFKIIKHTGNGIEVFPLSSKCKPDAFLTGRRKDDIVRVESISQTQYNDSMLFNIIPCELQKGLKERSKCPISNWAINEEKT